MVNDIRNIFDALRNSRKTLLDGNKAPALVRWIEEETRRIGLTNAPLVVHIDHTLPTAYGGFIQSAGEAFKPVVFVTEGAMQHVFGKPNLNLHVPDGLKAIIGHEMSHIKDGVNAMRYRSLPLFAMPLLTLIGYELYKHAKQRHHQDPSKPVKEHLNDVVEEEKQEARKHHPTSHKELEKPFLDWSNRFLALSLGLLAGGIITNRIAVANEFRADRAAVLASGNSKAMIEALTKLEESAMKVVNPQLKEWAGTMAKRSFMDNAKQIFGLIVQVFQEFTIHAHPSTASRVKAMERFAREKGLIKAETSAAHALAP